MEDETEVYKIDREDILSLQLMQSELEKVVLQQQLLKDRLSLMKERLATKYSEQGKYELVGDIDLEKCEGRRRLVEVES